MLTLGFWKSTLTNKSKEDRLRRWTLKWLLGDFYGQSLTCELILALVSLCLLVNSINKNPKEKRPIDFFCYFIQIYWLFYYYFASFGFKRGCGVKDQWDFILTEIKRYYNSNDRWKFILLLIRRENDLNKWLKHVKRGYKKQTK